MAELLAPAGDIEAGYAALYYGADAVYLGLKQFSARATAANFDETQLNEFAGYAHSLGRKVYAAVNTVAQQNELPQLLQTLDICARCHADGLIVQDLGVARIVREAYPQLELHASTQMAVHNKEGALTLQKLGFRRVVLARELTLAEIKDIAAVPGLETEAFVHGALCYSYSGLCLFSSMENGRSANRGKCLYPCRAEFEGEDGAAHYFSMKDMALEADILKLPVTSLKIEGRKKTALYVAAVTDYYRRILDGRDTTGRAENIRQIFSRPWCKFHLNGRQKDVTDREFVGHRGLLCGKIERLGHKSIIFKTKYAIGRHDGIQIDVPGEEKPFGFAVLSLSVNGKNSFEAAAGSRVEISLPARTPELTAGLNVYLASSSAVKGAYDYTKPKSGAFCQKIPVNVRVQIDADKIVAEAAGVRAEIGGQFEKAQNADKMADTVRQAFAKCGDALVMPAQTETDNPQGRFVPMSLLNELRRQLYTRIKPEYHTPELPAIASMKRPQAPQWLLRTDNIDCLAQIDLAETAEIIVLLDEHFDSARLQLLPKNKVRLALPTVCRNVSAWRPLIEELLAQGWHKWEIGNYWGREVLPEQGIDLSLDAPLYMFNTQAIAMAADFGAQRITLPTEDTLANLRQTAAASPLPVVFDVFGDVPLFISAACIRGNACKNCTRGEKWLTLRKEGHVYRALSKNCQTMLFDDMPFCAASEAVEIGVDYLRVSFNFRPYSAEYACKVWNSVRQFKDLEHVSKGNLHRSAL